MSTRCVINFCSGKYVDAKVYRHHDGYPEGVGPDLVRFFEEVERQTRDTRFNHPSYLAAKFVVWQADQLAYRFEYTPGEEPREVKERPLSFLGVGICIEDPGDIEYRWFVDSDKRDEKGRPLVRYEEVR